MGAFESYTYTLNFHCLFNIRFGAFQISPPIVDELDDILKTDKDKEQFQQKSETEHWQWLLVFIGQLKLQPNPFILYIYWSSLSLLFASIAVFLHDCNSCCKGRCNLILWARLPGREARVLDQRFGALGIGRLDACRLHDAVARMCPRCDGAWMTFEFRAV